MTIADSFIDNDPTPTCLEDLSPREKMAAFVTGMCDNAIDLVKFRCDPETSHLVAEREISLWQAKNALELVLSSIRVEHETPILRVVK